MHVRDWSPYSLVISFRAAFWDPFIVYEFVHHCEADLKRTLLVLCVELDLHVPSSFQRMGPSPVRCRRRSTVVERAEHGRPTFVIA